MRRLDPKNYMNETEKKPEAEMKETEAAPRPPEYEGYRHPALNSMEFVEFMNSIDPSTLQVSIRVPVSKKKE